jgi:hypothetical protein
MVRPVARPIHPISFSFSPLATGQGTRTADQHLRPARAIRLQRAPAAAPVLLPRRAVRRAVAGVGAGAQAKCAHRRVPPRRLALAGHGRRARVRVRVHVPAVQAVPNRVRGRGACPAALDWGLYPWILAWR